MTAYKRSDRPNSGFLISPVLPEPFGRVGPWQTNLQHRREAEKWEAMLREMAVTRPQVVQALIDGAFSVRDLRVAYLLEQTQPGHIQRLLDGVQDPPLERAVRDYQELCEDARARKGLDHLLAFAPAGARLSWLERETIAAFYVAMKKIMRPNSVYRGPHRGVRELLTHRFGSAGADRILADVKVPKDDDTRHVRLRPRELARLIDACSTDRFRWMVVLAIVTTFDRKQLLQLRVDDFDAEEGTLTATTGKTRKRARTVRLGAAGLNAVRLAVAGLQEGERLFPWTKWQVRKMWDATREAAGLPDLWLRDLRHVMPTVLAKMGVDRGAIEDLLGHAKGSQQTDRYVNVVGETKQIDAAEKRLGIDLSHLRTA